MKTGHISIGTVDSAGLRHLRKRHSNCDMTDNIAVLFPIFKLQCIGVIDIVFRACITLLNCVPQSCSDRTFKIRTSTIDLEIV